MQTNKSTNQNNKIQNTNQITNPKPTKFQELSSNINNQNNQINTPTQIKRKPNQNKSTKLTPNHQTKKSSKLKQILIINQKALTATIYKYKQHCERKPTINIKPTKSITQNKQTPKKSNRTYVSKTSNHIIANKKLQSWRYTTINNQYIKSSKPSKYNTNKPSIKNINSTKLTNTINILNQ